MTTVSPLQPYNWFDLAKNAEVVVSSQNFRRTNSQVENPLVIPSEELVADISSHLLSPPYFTFIKTGDILRESYPDNAFSEFIVFLYAVASLQLQMMIKLYDALLKHDNSCSSFDFKFQQLTPQNPIDYHRDYPRQKVYVSISCPQECTALAKTSFLYLGIDTGRNYCEMLDDSGKLKDEIDLNTGHETIELPEFSPRDGAIIFFNDTQLAHSATKQSGEGRRFIKVIDLIGNSISQLPILRRIEKFKSSVDDFLNGLSMANNETVKVSEVI